MPKTKVKTPAECEEFVSAVFERLCPGSLPGVFVRALNGNSFTLFAVTDDSAPPLCSPGLDAEEKRRILSGEGYGYDVAVRHDFSPRGAPCRGGYPSEIRVPGIWSAWNAASPALLMAPRPISLRRLAAEHGLDPGDAFAAAYEALACRINKLGATLVLMRPGAWGEGPAAEFRCGMSPQEAALRLTA